MWITLPRLLAEEQAWQAFGIDVDQVGGRVEEACKEYNTAVARPLCAQLYTDLPRELRDMIYGFALGDDVIVLVEWNTKRQPVVQCQREIEDKDGPPYLHPKPCSAADPLCNGSIWRAASSSMLIEVMESWYINSKFHFRGRLATDHRGLVPSYGLATILEHDRFKQTIDPKLLISNITHDFSIPSRFLYGGTGRTEAVEIVKLLLGLRRKAVIHFRLYWPGGRLWDMDEFSDFLRAIRAHVVYLRKAGHRLTIAFRRVMDHNNRNLAGHSSCSLRDWKSKRRWTRKIELPKRSRGLRS
jgi:hypothetical protein